MLSGEWDLTAQLRVPASSKTQVCVHLMCVVFGCIHVKLVWSECSVSMCVYYMHRYSNLYILPFIVASTKSYVHRCVHAGRGGRGEDLFVYAFREWGSFLYSLYACGLCPVLLFTSHIGCVISSCIAVLFTEAAQCGCGVESALSSHSCPISGDSTERGRGTQREDPDTSLDYHIPLQGECTEGSSTH